MRRIALLPLATALAAIWLAACGRGNEHGGFKPPPPVVEVITVEAETIRDTITLVGQLDSESSVEVRPELDGIVESIDFTEGQSVKKGDVLFRLRDAEQAAHVRQARARAKLAEEIFRRISALAESEISAQTEYDKASAELEVARSEVQLREVELEKTRVRAPFEGVVGARLVSPGERVRRMTKLVRIDAIDRLQLVFAVPEIGVPFVRTGMPVKISVKPFPEIRFDGEVFFVSPTLDASTRRLSLKAWVPNPGRKLQPSQFHFRDTRSLQHQHSENLASQNLMRRPQRLTRGTIHKQDPLQAHSIQGQRARVNREILFDPRHPQSGILR